MSYKGTKILATDLAQREIELLNKGLSYKFIAQELGVKIGTLKERNRLLYKVDIYSAFRKRIEREGIPNRLSVGNDFGHYFVGFFDGEGSIVAYHRIRNGPKPYPEFRLSIQIALRDDDLNVLEYFRNNLGGVIHRNRTKRGKTNPTAVWVFESTKDLAEIIVPLFNRYKLHSKKKREYEIWRPLVIERYLATLGGETARGKGVFESMFIDAIHRIKLIRQYPDGTHVEEISW